MPRVLVAGWFSFPWMGATAGDLLSAEAVSSWLAEAGVPHDLAMSEELGGGVRWDAVEPAGYSHVVFVCGPLGNGEPFLGLRDRFPHARWIGCNLSMLHSIDEWNPFDLLLERDSDRTARPDVTFAVPGSRVPVVGVVLVHPQREYEGGRHDEVHAVIDAVLVPGEFAPVAIDTCFDPPNTTGLRTAAEVESVIARMDLVVTTRLHGLALALKAGVPVVAVDPIAGGAKVRRQAEVLGWPAVLTPEDCDESALRTLVAWCGTDDSKALAREVATAAATRVEADVAAPLLAAVLP
jgi:hypothetical protein